MSKRLIIVSGVTVVTVTLVFAGLAFAQTPTPPAADPAPGQGWGMMRGRGGWMGSGQAYTDTVPMGPGMMRGYGGRGMMGGLQRGGGLLHDYMLDAFAEALNLPRAALDERVAAGESMYDIAVGQGLSPADFVALMQTTREAALDQAVADGVITPEQADWMRSHGGRGNCPHSAPAEAAPSPAN